MTKVHFIKVQLQLLIVHFLILIVLSSICTSRQVQNPEGCKQPFEGFGAFLGSTVHFYNSPSGTVQKVIDQVYNDLRIRYYRTSYESEFSLSKDNYSISCSTSNSSCTWIEIQEAISHYPNISLFASVWSPPLYMKNGAFDTLQEEYELPYLYFIKNITQIIKSKFNLTIEQVSPVNEPENVFAPWEHTNMGPYQMCRMVQSFNDPLITLCPENSYFWMSELYMNYTDNSTGVDCPSTCGIYATHSYTLNIDFFSPYHLLAYYDLGQYPRTTDKPIWMTEVSSTFGDSEENQMKEAFDLATNIVNFLGTTCVQRYYYWFMYTLGASGESLIWGYDNQTGEFNLPKKYFVYRHFTLASYGEPKNVTECVISNNTDFNGESSESSSGESQLCLLFGAESIVLVNKDKNHYSLEGIQCKTPFCCTTKEFDWFCIIETTAEVILPKMAVCSCTLNSTTSDPVVPLVITVNATIFTNEVH